MSDATIASSESLERRKLDFHRRFLLRTCGGLTLAGLVSVVVFAWIRPELELLASAAIVALSCGAGFVLALTHQPQRGAQVLLGGLSVCAILSAYWFAETTMVVGSVEALLVAAVLAPFLLEERAFAALVAIQAVGILGSHAAAAVVRDIPLADIGPTMAVTPVLLLFLSYAIRGFVGHARETQQLLAARLRDIDTVVEQAQRIAGGDLSSELEGEGAVQDIITQMVAGLRGLVENIQGGIHRLNSASSEIAAMAEQQEQSSVEQSAAIEETGRTIESLLGASREIAGSAESVARNAEATQSNAETIASRLSVLASETERISEILDLIREVATKSEFLALNAALEGAKAGEAGRGFSLVAAQMQRLAESVMESVASVKQLTASIQEATRATVLATEEATKLAADTTDAARRIRVITRQQESSTEQVTRAMSDISQANQQATSGTAQTLEAVRELVHIAEGLDAGAQTFRL